MQAQGGQGHPHACQWAALRGHRGHDSTMNSTVDKPHPGELGRFVNSGKHVVIVLQLQFVTPIKSVVFTYLLEVSLCLDNVILDNR